MPDYYESENGHFFQKNKNGQIKRISRELFFKKNSSNKKGGAITHSNQNTLGTILPTARLFQSKPLEIVTKLSSNLKKKYFEYQDSPQSCGRHALNNLLGGPYFVFNPNIPDWEIYDLDVKPKGIINLHKLCLTLQKIFYNHNINSGSIHNNSDKCSKDENYNYSVLIAALCLFNYDFIKEFHDFDILSDYLRDQQQAFRNNNDIIANFELNILVNYGNFHWVAICKYKFDSKIYFYDSLREEIVIFEDLFDFIQDFNGDGCVFLIFKKFETTEYKNPVRELFRKRNLNYNSVVKPSYYNNILKSVPKLELDKYMKNHEIHFLKSTKKSEIPSLANINRKRMNTYEKQKKVHNKLVANEERRSTKFTPVFRPAPPNKPITGWRGLLTSHSR